MRPVKIVLILAITISSVATAIVWAQSANRAPQTKVETAAVKPAVTFIELGSVNCIPCVRCSR